MAKLVQEFHCQSLSRLRGHSTSDIYTRGAPDVAASRATTQRKAVRFVDFIRRHHADAGAAIEMLQKRRGAGSVRPTRRTRVS
jgi:hypothetical protein